MTHHSIGLDDLSYDRYYFGELFAQGRMTGTIVMHLLGMAQSIYHTWTIDLLGILLFVFSGILFSALFMSISKENDTYLPFTLFTSLYVSYPISSELFGFLGTTIAIGGGMICVILAIYWIYLLQDFEKPKRWRFLFYATLLLFIVSSWYESVLSVYICAVFAVFILEFEKGQKSFPKWYSFIIKGLRYAIPLIIAISLEFLVSNLLIKVLGISPSNNADNFIAYHSGEILTLLRRLVVRFTRDYIIMGIWYLPITVLVLSAMISIVLCIKDCVGKKSIIPVFFYGGMLFSLTILSLIQGFSSPYRTAQVCNFFISFIGYLLVFKSKLTMRKLSIFLLFFVVFWQANDLNKWFELDYVRSEEERHVAQQIGYELEKNYDCNKPILFVGNYTLSDRLLDAVMIRSDNRFLKFINTIYPIGNYFPSEKYWIRIQRFNIYSYLSWGGGAFHEVNTELLKYFSYYGFDFKQGTEKMLENAKKVGEDLPSWPKTGSIIDVGDFIVVNLGKESVSP
ncbi:glucosyltransferase domain-containing protein [Sphaerochaeta sp.]|uniref:glucosyltransferase domain-containing protein n=1 Tax=Sphaerochaeta sp. TaxID=1972642 RepID=UPI002FCC11D8